VLAVIASAGLASCDPGTTSNDIGLGRDSSGQLVALVQMCQVALSTIEIVDGPDRFGDATAVISAVDPVTGLVVVPLAEPGEGFDVDKGAHFLADPSAPLVITASTDDGVWGDQVFDRLPEPGTALFSTGTTNAPAAHPIDEFAANADCP